MVMAALRPFADKAFDAARKQGRRERPEAYAWDALVGLASSGGGGAGGSGDWAMAVAAGGGTWPRGPRRQVMVRVDYSALLRGYPVDGETCDIPGFGPTTVEAVRAMIATGDPELKAIVDQRQGRRRCGAHAPAPQRLPKKWSRLLVPDLSAMGSVHEGLFLTDRPPRRLGAYPRHGARAARQALPLPPQAEDHQGLGLGRGTGERDFVPPDDPRHPRHGKAQHPTRGAGARVLARSAMVVAPRGRRQRGLGHGREGAGLLQR